MSAGETTLEDLKKLIEDQGREQGTRTAELGARTTELVTSVKHATDQLQEHGRRIESIEQGREEDRRRLVSVESSSAQMNERFGQFSETIRQLADNQGKYATDMRTVKDETKTQSVLLLELRDDKVARTAVDNDRAKRAESSNSRRNLLIGLITAFLAVLSIIGGFIAWVIENRHALP